MPGKKLSLPAKIIIGLILGVVWGFVMLLIPGGVDFTGNYIRPFGNIFIKLLQMIAIPLIISSLITGVSRLQDISSLSRMGLRTIFLFLITATVAIVLGLLLVNVFQPGAAIPEELRDSLVETYRDATSAKADQVAQIRTSPLQPLEDIIPSNIMQATADNSRMLQVVFFSLLIGLALIKVPLSKGEIVIRFFEGINEVLIKIVEFVMKFAPFGVFALMAALIADTAGDLQLLLSLLLYALTVLTGLIILLFVIYPIVYTNFSNIRYLEFFKGMRPALLVAFSTSSSSATLPVTMERVEKHLGVKEEVAGFVLPLGTTINMDGTALYQAIAAVFIAQALGIELSILTQATIVLTATLSAIGAAGVPGAGMITLIIVMESVGVPVAGIALIMAPDRILDMCRSVVNVSGDAVASVVVNKMEDLKINKAKKDL